MAVLTEEVGELARVISRTYGDQRAKPGEFPRGAGRNLGESEVFQGFSLWLFGGACRGW